MFYSEDEMDEEAPIKCRSCGVPVYWGDHYSARGEFDRRLYTASSRRLHDCRVKPDADAFDVVPE